MRSTLLLLTVLFGLASCGLFITEEDCSGSGLYSLGVGHGEQGAAASRFSHVNKVCQKHGITPDPKDWLKGRAVGLRSYCTPARAYEIGESGGTINNVCPPKARALMTEPYLDGRHVYKLEQRVSSAESDLAEMLERIANTDPAANPSQYRHLVHRQLKLERRIRSLERDMERSDRSGWY